MQGKDMMIRKVILITGGAGLLGSHLLVALYKNHTIISIDKRSPSKALIKAAPGARWFKLDISDSKEVDAVFKQIISEWGQIDYIIHLAAYYHFGEDWRKEYETTNISGSEHLINSAIHYKAGKIIFASSIAALEPKDDGSALNEATIASDYFPYAKSKFVGERLFKNASEKIPVVIIRFGGIFTDWCELPPLFSMIKLWLSAWPLSIVIPGKGESGMPYIHIRDAVKFIIHCLNATRLFNSFHVLIASQIGTIQQKDLYILLKKLTTISRYKKPVMVPVWILEIVLRIRIFLEGLFRTTSFERPWMLKYIDHPWIVDNSYSQEILDWQPRTDLDLRIRINNIVTHFRENKRKWIERNTCRQAGRFSYSE